MVDRFVTQTCVVDQIRGAEVYARAYEWIMYLKLVDRYSYTVPRANTRRYVSYRVRIVTETPV